jgi:hypothetical protein
MAKGDAPKLFDELDVLLLAGLALGMTQEKAGKWAATPQFRDGVSDRTVRNRLEATAPTSERLLMKLSEAFRRKEEAFEELTRDAYKKKLETLRDKAYKVKERALDNALDSVNDTEALALGVKVADGVEDRDLGKASQVHKHEGSVIQNHVFWNPQPVRALAEQEVDMLNSSRLLAALPADAIEAEVVQG